VDLLFLRFLGSPLWQGGHNRRKLSDLFAPLKGFTESTGNVFFLLRNDPPAKKPVPLGSCLLEGAFEKTPLMMPSRPLDGIIPKSGSPFFIVSTVSPSEPAPPSQRFCFRFVFFFFPSTGYLYTLLKLFRYVVLFAGKQVFHLPF